MKTENEYIVAEPIEEDIDIIIGLIYDRLKESDEEYLFWAGAYEAVRFVQQRIMQAKRLVISYNNETRRSGRRYINGKGDEMPDEYYKEPIELDLPIDEDAARIMEEMEK